jgi:carboxyl-terminal processing protease
MALKKTNHIHMKSPKHFLWIGIFSLTLISCNKEDEEPKVDPTSKEAVNQWISSVMNQVYYWLDDIRTPIAESSNPEDYFESLLFRPTDRYSVIYPDYQELINQLSGISLDPGYEFILYRRGSTQEVYGEIIYIKDNSPAKSTDLKRGDQILKINGTAITVNNFREVVALTNSAHTLEFQRFNVEKNQYEVQSPVNLVPVELAENPNFLDTIYTVNNQKIGYVVHHFFASGRSFNSKEYDNETDAIFAKFKAEKIDHLILDLRYNRGGLVTSAENLANLVAPSPTSTDIFSKRKYNSFLTENVPDLRNQQTFFKVKAENLGKSLAGNRVYILTSSRTASAPELIINGLKPYMDVFLVGDFTEGKNVGSVPFEDTDNPANKYGILPIVSKSFNSLDQSDYSEGFRPNLVVKETQERLRPLGDINELLLRTAISQITGLPSGGRTLQLDRKDIGGSQDFKFRNGIMVEVLNFKGNRLN